MGASWSDAAAAALKLTTLVFRVAGERRDAERARTRDAEQRKLGLARAVAETLQDVLALAETARDARLDVRNRLRSNPDSLRDDDGFRRDG